MSKFGFDKVRRNMEQTKRELPVMLANQAVNYFTRTFNKQGFDGQKWKEVKRRIPGTREYRYPKDRGLSRRTKPILIGTGRLRRAVSASKKQATWDRVKLVVDLPYAAAQNEGTNKIPKREYMGDSRELRKDQYKLIDKEVDKIWRID